jgi:hypothetical protein
VWEETGWHVERESLEVLGWVHLEALFDRPEVMRFPHPDSFMSVVRVTPTHCEDDQATWADRDGYVARSAFMPVSGLPLEVAENPVTAVFLDAAFDARWRPS